MKGGALWLTRYGHFWDQSVGSGCYFVCMVAYGTVGDFCKLEAFVQTEKRSYHRGKGAHFAGLTTYVSEPPEGHAEGLTPLCEEWGEEGRRLSITP